MRRTFQYKAKISPSTERNALEWLELCRQLFNACLEQRIDAYVRCRKSVNKFAQSKELLSLKKEFPEFKKVGSQVLQEVVERLDKSYQAFFRKLKKKEKVGLPRFKGKNRYNSFTLKQCGWQLEGNRLSINNIGTFKLFLSRPILGDIKTITIKHTRTGKWFVSFSCDNVPEKVLEPCKKEIGIDVGVKVFLADSDGNFIESPKYFRGSEKIVSRKQRRFDRRKKGSNRREGARIQVAKIHEKITNQRKDFINKLALRYIKENGTIYIEDLKIPNMIQNKYLSKSIWDSGWGAFALRLTVAAEEARRSVIRVNPKNTSQICLCGEMVKKSLAVRVHKCPKCGLEMDRDILAAKNILRLGQSRQALTKELSLVA